MSIVVLKVIALVLERIEGLVFYLPASTPHTHHLFYVGFTQSDASDPGKRLLSTFFVELLIIEHVDPQIAIAAIQSQSIGVAKAVGVAVLFPLHPFDPSPLIASFKLPE